MHQYKANNMNDLQLGSKVMICQDLDFAFDTEWTILDMDGNRLYLSSYDDSFGYQNIVVNKTLVQPYRTLQRAGNDVQI
ncbi:MAG: hypothetical protein EOP48_25070 [Sphingobacteriales bacterium]|nr:MAG: hypothetical protein EOP48_25070 [Sphingobacteriales bacterium]